MNLTLSWDLFISVFIALVVAYSFIIGKHQSVKVIVAAYIAIVAVHGIESLIVRFGGDLQSSLGALQIPITPNTIALFKLILFIGAVVLLTIKGGLAVSYEGEPGMIINVLITGVLGFAKAGLLLSTLTTYVAGVPLLSTTQAAPLPLLQPLLQQSWLLRMMLDYRDLWFALPALVLIIVDLVSSARD